MKVLSYDASKIPENKDKKKKKTKQNKSPAKKQKTKQSKSPAKEYNHFLQGDNYELTPQHSLNEIPPTITLNNKQYLISSVILFEPPYSHLGVGHFSTAIRLNERWEVFDDLRSNTYFVSSTQKLVVHSIMYLCST